MKTLEKNRFRDLPKKYTELCEDFLPRPIHDKVQYENTIEIADNFAGHEDAMTEGQEDYFDLLCDLIEKYEEEIAPKAQKLTGQQLLKHLADEHGINGTDIGKILGRTEQLGRMVLKGTRTITVEHAAKLSAHFGIGMGAFLERS
jgi:HTH-type transcriptional regulator/antitoxin HigA